MGFFKISGSPCRFAAKRAGGHDKPGQTAFAGGLGIDNSAHASLNNNIKPPPAMRTVGGGAAATNAGDSHGVSRAPGSQPLS